MQPLVHGDPQLQPLSLETVDHQMHCQTIEKQTSSHRQPSGSKHCVDGESQA
jgi:hypothetical protein